MLSCFTFSAEKIIPIVLVLEKELSPWLSQQEPKVQNWVNTSNFRAKSGSINLIHDQNGYLEKVLVGMSNSHDWMVFGQIAAQLPEGHYQIESLPEENLFAAALAWALGSYQFTTYKKSSPLKAKLILPKTGLNLQYLEAVSRATYLVRDLINTPANDMMPADLADATTKLAEKFGATVSSIQGEALLKQGYVAIYSVGRASSHSPQLIDLRWGDSKHPKIILVGKGVCFDSGGLDLKSAANMAFMKKDMAGAAHVLGLAYVIMHLNLPVSLRVLIPAVENAVSGNAYRPGDILKTRQGTTVEITNTDAEGRLILCEALDEAAKEKPELIIDFASLTGAARVALGTDIAALFTTNSQLATDLMAYGEKENDPIWRLPVYTPYRKLLDSKIADITNSASVPYGGAITAAVFLKEFVPDGMDWVHFDIMAWNTNTKPGAPEGGEANALRAVARYLYERYTRN